MRRQNQNFEQDCQIFELGGKKKLQVKRFQGQIFVDIREYFQKDYNKEMFPTKKGVSLSLEIWSSLLSKAKEIN